MVHRGPAKGCKRCKERHIKCDLDRPACRQCAKLNFSCPGYRHELDVVLRDQTASVVRRHQNQRHNSPSSLVNASCTTPQAYFLPKDITLGLESHALAFLVSTSGLLLTRDWRTSHGHLDCLQPLYRNVASDSPLAVATSWLAVLVLGTCDKGRPYPLETLLMARVIKSLLAAIKDPINSLKDETLTAIILVSYGEHLRDRRYGLKPSSSIHQDGAEALIRRRGYLNFRGSSSLALFDAVRHNAVSLAISGRRETRNWDLWKLHGDTGHLCDSYTPATELDACGVIMVDLKTQLESKDFHAGIALREILLKLLERLRCWQYRVPSEWIPQQTMGSKPTYPSPEVSYLFDEWYLLQLEVSHLMKDLDARMNAMEIPALHYLCEMEWIGNIVASEDSFFGSGPNKCDSLSQMEPTGLTYADKNFPCATAQQCSCSPLASRLFGQTLDKLDLIVSRALKDLRLPSKVALRYHEVRAWARRERDTIQRANLTVIGDPYSHKF